MKAEKPTFVVMDRFRSGAVKDDRDEPLGITEDPVKALKMAKRARSDGRIEMRLPDGTTKTFVAKRYDAVDRKQPGHRYDAKGDDRYHGFIQHCETSGYGSPVAKVKPRTSGKRTRATTKATRRK